jgi:hypothetical protein
MKASIVREIAQLRQGEFLKTLAMMRAQVDLQVMEAATQSLKGVNIIVPISYVGREPYDVIEMGKTLVEQLQADGYTVTGTFLKFRVSWDKATSPRKAAAAEDEIVVVKATKKH